MFRLTGKLKVGTQLKSIASQHNKNLSDRSITEARPSKSIPGPRVYPLIGNAYILFQKNKDGEVNSKRQHLMFRDMAAKYGPVFRANFFGYDTIHVTDPAITKEIMLAEGQYPKVPFLSDGYGWYKTVKTEIYPPTGSKGLIGIEGTEWWETRQLFQKDLMRPGASDYYIAGLEDIADEFVSLTHTLLDKKTNQVPDNFLKLFQLWAVESNAYVFLEKRLDGIKPESINDKTTVNNRMADAAHVLHEQYLGLRMIMPIWRRWPNLLQAHRKFDEAMTSIHTISKDYINDKRKMMEIEKEKGIEKSKKSILEKLFERAAGHPELEQGIPIFIAEAIPAALESIGFIVGMVLYHLAIHPEYQQMAYKEIMEVIGDRPLGEGDTRKLRFLKACMDETLRIFPSTRGTEREIQKDTVLGGYHVPKGTTVLMNHMVMMLHYPQPHDFIPERWVRGSDHPLAGTNPPFGILSFGHGKRQCIGKRFALKYCTVLLLKMIKEFHIEYHGEPIGLVTKNSTMNRADKPLRLKLTRRTNV